MVEEKEQDSGTGSPPRSRSPSFPFISLGTAIDRVRDLEAEFKHHYGRISDALPVWNYKPKSSGGLRTVSALKAFGLINDTGSGKDRKIKVSELALKILKDKRPGVREAAQKEAALNPKLFSKFLNKWGYPRPSDAVAESELTLDFSFDEQAAKKFLKVYDETIRFAELENRGGPTPENQDDEEESEMNETPSPEDEFTVPPGPKLKQPPGSRRAVFALTEGDVTIIFPGKLSEESVGDLRAYIEIFLTKAEREAKD